MKNNFKKQKEKLLDITEKVNRTLDLPQTAVPGNPFIEISGNHEAVVDGCKGILQYDEDVIRLNAGKVIINFKGCELSICSMLSERVVINGKILSIDFSS